VQLLPAHAAKPHGQEACRATWREIARQAGAGSKFFTCHAGVQYVAAPIVDDGKPAVSS